MGKICEDFNGIPSSTVSVFIYEKSVCKARSHRGPLKL